MQPCIRVEPIPGKGLGTRATRPILCGSLVLEEQPILRAAMPECMTTMEELTQWLNDYAETMTDEVREDMLKLACKTDTPTLLGVYAVNNFGCRGETLVYRRISRLNHSCNPNCAHSFDIDRGIGQVWALRDIKEDEELCLTYVELLLEGQNRRAYLNEVYGFDCDCATCTHPTLESDRRRVLLNWCIGALSPNGPLVTAFNNADEAPELAEEARTLGLRLAVQVLRLFAEEDLPGANDRAGHICQAAAFFLVGNPEPQCRWAEQCLERIGMGGSRNDVLECEEAIKKVKLETTVLPKVDPKCLQIFGDPKNALKDYNAAALILETEQLLNSFDDIVEKMSSNVALGQEPRVCANPRCHNVHTVNGAYCCLDCTPDQNEACQTPNCIYHRFQDHSYCKKCLSGAN